MQRLYRILSQVESNSSKFKQNKKNAELECIFKEAQIIPVIPIKDLKTAVPLANALRAGGVKVIEVALSPPFISLAYSAIKQIKKECPDMLVGAATVMTKAEMYRAIKAGADFCASPMLDLELIEFAHKYQYAYLPCVSNMTQINEAAKKGFRFQKLFPTEALDGSEEGEKFLRGTVTMADKLNVGFCTSCLETKPTNIGKYLKHKNVSAIASGWSAPTDLVDNKDWAAITEKTKQDLAEARKVKAEANSTVVQNTVFAPATVLKTSKDVPQSQFKQPFEPYMPMPRTSRL